jgi:hypothetical protein
MPEKVNQAEQPMPSGPPYNPLAEEVVTKPHMQGRASVDPSLLNQPIAEQQFTAPGVDKERHPLDDGKGGNNVGSGNMGAGYGQPGADPGLKDLPPKEKGVAADQLVAFCFRGYEKLHKWANGRLQISDKKILKLQANGSIDLRANVPYTLTEMMTLGEFITEYNKDMADLLSIDPEWRAEIEPPLARIFAKRGLGMSDEVFVGMMLLTDISVKTQQYFAAMSRTDAIMAFAKEQTARMHEVITMNSRPSQAPPPPPPAPDQGPAPVVNMPTGNNPVDQFPPAQMATASSIPIQDHVMGVGAQDNGPMAGAVGTSQLPEWGGKAEQLNKRGRKPGSKNSATTKRKKRA